MALVAHDATDLQSGASGPIGESACVAGNDSAAWQSDIDIDQDVAKPRCGSALDRFFTARIGLRFLMEHHIESRAAQPEGWSGVIQADFDPTDVLRHAVDDATRLCEDEYGTAPRTIVRMAAVEDAPCESRNSRLTYVPSHMHYICVEVRDLAVTRSPPNGCE